jgi:transposase
MTAGRVLCKTQQHLQSFLLRHDRIYRGLRAWTSAYRRWLTTVRFDHPAQQIVLQDYIHAVQDAEARRDRLTRQINELVNGTRRHCASGNARGDPGGGSHGRSGCSCPS